MATKSTRPKKFHITNDGEQKECKAQVRECQYKDNQETNCNFGEHFDTKAEAKEYYQKKITSYLADKTFTKKKPEIAKPEATGFTPNVQDMVDSVTRFGSDFHDYRVAIYKGFYVRDPEAVPDIPSDLKRYIKINKVTWDKMWYDGEWEKIRSIVIVAIQNKFRKEVYIEGDMDHEPDMDYLKKVHFKIQPLGKTL